MTRNKVQVNNYLPLELLNAALADGHFTSATEGLKKCHSEPYYCQVSVSAKPLKVSGEESLSTLTEILRAKNNCHPQNDVIVHEPIKFIYKRQGKFVQSKLVKILLTYLPTYLLTKKKAAFTLAEVFSPHSVSQRKIAFTLAEVFTPHFIGYRKTAFTLAEVLITLGIIGVVAAMTLPSLVNKIQGRELQTQYKKAYSILTQAVNRMNAEQGFVANFDSYSPCTGEFGEMFSKYFIKAADCGKNSCSTSMENNNYTTKYKTYTGSAGSAIWFDDGQYIISDAMFISINHCNAENKILIGVDINGLNKRPNRYGQDFFIFQIIEDGKLLPMGSKGTQMGGASWYSANQSPETLCSSTSTSSTNGFTCAYFASTDDSFFANLPK